MFQKSVAFCLKEKQYNNNSDTQTIYDINSDMLKKTDMTESTSFYWRYYLKMDTITYTREYFDCYSLVIVN